MQSLRYKLVEFFVLYILIPVLFALALPFALKAVIAILGFLYIIYILLKVEKNQFKVGKNLNWKLFWKNTSLKFIVIICLTTAYVWWVDKDNLFVVVYYKTLLWSIILFVYSVFSVYPQELIFRTFFFQRYQGLFSNNNLFIFVNAIVFSLAHIFYRNTLVLVITFLGGILFALTFNRTRSTIMVSIEHAIYGCWLFTVGMGDMLGFPS